MAQLGILFDLDELGSGGWSLSAYRILFAAIDATELAGCRLRSGVTKTMLAGGPAHFCIAVESTDGTTVARLRQAVAASSSPGLRPRPERFLEAADLAQEPLDEVASVSLLGEIVGGPPSIAEALAATRAERQLRAARVPVGRRWWEFWKDPAPRPPAASPARRPTPAVLDAPKAAPEPRVVVGACASCHRPLKTRQHAVRESMALTCKCGASTRVQVPEEVLRAAWPTRPRPAPRPAPVALPAGLDEYQVLADLCDAYVRDDKAAITRLEPLATRIGEDLNRRGGLALMRSVWEGLGNRRGSRTLDMHWNGIGEWRG